MLFLNIFILPIINSFIQYTYYSLLVFIIIFAAIGVVGTAVVVGSYSRIFSVKKTLMAYQNSRFYNQLKFADDKGKIVLLNKRIEKAKGEKLAKLRAESK